MSDIRCTRDGYECNGCPIKEKCDDADNHTAINLWEIYQQGRADAIDECAKEIEDILGSAYMADNLWLYLEQLKKQLKGE